MPPVFRSRPLPILAVLLLLAAKAALAQQPDSAAGRLAPTDSAWAAGGDTAGAFMVDTIVVMEDVRGLVWRDWYVNPDVGTQVQQAIQRRGQLSGRTWITSAAPIRNLALGKPAGETQNLSFVDWGEDQGFWSAGDVQYGYVFKGPLGMDARGTVRSARVGPTEHLVRIPLPVPDPDDAEPAATRDRVGRLDVTYKNVRPRSPASAASGRFSIYLYYLNPELGYRIAGVGY